MDPHLRIVPPSTHDVGGPTETDHIWRKPSEAGWTEHEDGSAECNLGPASLMVGPSKRGGFDVEVIFGVDLVVFTRHVKETDKSRVYAAAIGALRDYLGAGMRAVQADWF